MATSSALGPKTSFTTGLLILSSTAGVNTGTGFDLSPSKFLRIMAMAESGLKSPDIQIAMLLGT